MPSGLNTADRGNEIEIWPETGVVWLVGRLQPRLLVVSAGSVHLRLKHAFTTSSSRAAKHN